MKLALIGAAGVRAPLLVGGLTRSELPIDEVVLFDLDRERLALIGPLAQRTCARGALRLTDRVEDCVEGADFVLTSIRPGGIEARARNEAAALARGVVGQETVGPCGFAMAMATIPAMVGYAREVAQRAPRAFLVNFTNPVGIVTQAMTTATDARAIGICDTPTELFEEAAHALGVPSAECHFDYFGLNHLGWLREVRHRGVPQLARLWNDPARLVALYRSPLFEAERLAGLRLLPTEYVYYYYRPERAVANLRRAGTSRGAVIQALNRKLFADLRRGAGDPLRIYEDYLAARDAGYMQLESGASGPRARPHWLELTGYDKIALSVLQAIHGNSGAVIPLDVPNRGNLGTLKGDDVVEVPCVVNASGAWPLHVEPPPESVRPLLEAVKRYERLTVEAALTGSKDGARRALAANPLVRDEALAADLIQAMGVA
ncbi:MAG: 6-phospho-beta-glucosidase [Vicinamibacteria bacterium]